MGNFRWAERRVARHAVRGPVVEIGAGDGTFLRRLEVRSPAADLTGIDLAPRPAGLKRASWLQGDLFTLLPEISAEVLVGIMIVHHFPDEQLRALGALCERFPVVIFCEPWRARLPLLWGGLMHPWVGPVTRHDLPASVRAGFRRGELVERLGWKNRKIEETIDWRGANRIVAWK